MQKSFYATGRLKAGERNKTEAAYEQQLKLLQHAGEIIWFKFEGIKFKLADNTYYTPDFAVMLKTGEIEIHEVKGSKFIFMDDAKVKIKVAAETYPFIFKVIYPLKGGHWEVVIING